jgi:hypothetical protein
MITYNPVSNLIVVHVRDGWEGGFPTFEDRTRYECAGIATPIHALEVADVDGDGQWPRTRTRSP